MRILCAIVTYNESFDATRAAKSLAALPDRWRERLEICCAINEGGARIDQCVSQERSESTWAGMPLVARRTGGNGGLALGYNLALEELRSGRCEFLLFLNSDSAVTTDLLDAFASALGTASTHLSRVLAPRLTSGSIRVS